MNQTLTIRIADDLRTITSPTNPYTEVAIGVIDY